MATFIRNYVDGCTTCQQCKINRHPSVPALMPIKGSDRPFNQISFDFITDLPESNGFDSLLVVVDHGLTKGVILAPCTKKISALETTELILNYVYKWLGLPDKMFSDRGPQFAARVFQELGKLLGIKQAMSTAYHPQTDGVMERSNQETEAYLAIFCANNPERWSYLLPTLEFSYNQKSHATQKHSPFYLTLGYDPKAIPTAFPKTNIPEAKKRILELQHARDEAQAAHKLARAHMFDRTTNKFKPFKKGDKVWLNSKNLKLRYERKKVAPKHEGPFTITEVLGPLTYRLALPAQWRIHPVFHASLLSPYKETDAHGPNFTLPPPEMIEGEEEYEVEAILKHCKRGKGYQYLVKWKGYPTEENQWEPATHLENAGTILEKYKKRHKLQ